MKCPKQLQTRWEAGEKNEATIREEKVGGEMLIDNCAGMAGKALYFTICYSTAIRL